MIFSFECFQFKQHYFLTNEAIQFITILLFLIGEHTQDKKSMMYFTIFIQKLLMLENKKWFYLAFINSFSFVAINITQSYCSTIHPSRVSCLIWK